MNKPFTNKGITSENIEEQKLQEFIDKLTDSKFLLSFEEIEKFMKPYENLRGNEFYNPYYHLPFYKFLSEYIAKKYNVKKDSPEMRKFLRNDLWYEIITQELINELTNHIGKRLNIHDHITILEVGAGNGKLSYHLNKNLKNKYSDRCTLHAIDSWYENIPSIFDIERMSDSEAIARYNPDIILWSWMPQKPFWFQLLERKYWSQISDTIQSTDEYKEYSKYCADYRIERSKYPEYSATRRKQCNNLKEYILIGPLECCGDKEYTFWMPWANDDRSRTMKAANHFFNNKQMFEKSLIEKPAYYDDGYLMDVSNFDKLINEEDITRFTKYNKFDHLVSSSFLISFKNRKYLSWEEINILEDEHGRFTEQVNADDLPF